MPPLSIPTTAPLSPTHRLPSIHPSIHKILSKLTRTSLLSVALDWLDDGNQPVCSPYLSLPNPDDDDLYPPVSTLAELRDLYTELQEKNGSKRDVLDRILEGDWREGVSLYMLAMADMQYLYDHPLSQKWSALKIVSLSSPASPSTSETLPPIPRFHPATFLRNLQREALPDVKVHYNLDRHATLPLLILRIFILESPYNTERAIGNGGKVFDASKTFYVAFPDGSPYIYVSLTNASTAGTGGRRDVKSLRRLMLEAIPKAFSRPGQRYKLDATQFYARGLEALVEWRGGGRTNAAGGGWGIYNEDEGRGGEGNPLNLQLPTPDDSTIEEEEEEQEKEEGRGMKRKRIEDEALVKRRKLVAKGRFGNSAKKDDGKGIERLDIRLEDPFPSTRRSATPDLQDGYAAARRQRQRIKGRRSDVDVVLDRADSEDVEEQGEMVWRPDVRIGFHGQHVFAGIRELVELGVVDGEAMPGWMTGEEGVSVGVVKEGRIRGFKGSGI